MRSLFNIFSKPPRYLYEVPRYPGLSSVLYIIIPSPSFHPSNYSQLMVIKKIVRWTFAIEAYWSPKRPRYIRKKSEKSEPRTFCVITETSYSPAIQAVLNVAKTPVAKALGVNKTISAPLAGAKAAKIPIEIPLEAMFPNPHTA